MRNSKLARALAAQGRLAGICALVMGLAGCGMGGMFGGGSTPDSQFANASASQADIAKAAPNALPAIATECPPIKVRPGGETMFYYGSGKVGTPQDLHYQVVLDKQTRNCVVSNGLITVKMGVVGRVLLGPSGKETAIKVPLRFAVERNSAAVFSQKYVIPVAITPPSQSEQFIKVVENVAIPYLGGEDITIWVGFDPKG